MVCRRVILSSTRVLTCSQFLVSVVGYVEFMLLGGRGKKGTIKIKHKHTHHKNLLLVLIGMLDDDGRQKLT